MPGVTVVLPIQGYKTHSLLNWQSQLGMQYAGPVEYLFVTQSALGTPVLHFQLNNFYVVKHLVRQELSTAC